ncbi:MAG: response regulator [Verrucomicrobiae bacterium]|nr:response regulator [Verrucomicrobiae bacterium]
MNVAVVDDDASLCRSSSRRLRAAGLQPATYHSAGSFLDDALRPHFDCLLLDVQPGGMSGLELSRRLAERNDTTPIIFITALEDPELRTQAQTFGCAGFFRKTDPGCLVVDAIQKSAGPAGFPARSRTPAGESKPHNEPAACRIEPKPL